jgi:glycosyltransferase involved in cell wall biosynthesis
LADRIVVLNNFELPDFDASATAVSPLQPSGVRLRISFTGNLGRFQGLDVIVHAVLSQDSRLDGAELVFMGEGAAKQHLESIVAAAPKERRNRVVFLPHGTPSSARALLRTSDIGLVSLTPGVIGYAYPSKTATYLSEGLPLLLAVEQGCELSKLVESEGVGFHLSVDDEEAVVQCILELIERRDDLPDMSRRALKVWEREFAAEVQLPRWSKLLTDLARGWAA